VNHRQPSLASLMRRPRTPAENCVTFERNVALWHTANLAPYPLFGRYRMQSGHRTDFAASLGATQSGHQ
jgi:hypothetical protein